MIKYDENEVLKVCQESDSMAKAASKLNIHMNTFRRIAKKIGCYKPNQAGKGIKKTLAESIPPVFSRYILEEFFRSYGEDI